MGSFGAKGSESSTRNAHERRLGSGRSILWSIMSTAVLVLAAGRGRRLGSEIPKAFVPLSGVPLVVRSIETLLAVDGVDWVQPVLADSECARFQALSLPPDSRLADPVPGGAERQDSVAAGLAALPVGVKYVAVHDAARCLVTVSQVETALGVAREHRAAILAAPVRDTVKIAKDGVVVETPDRALCWAAQTPQVFERGLLGEALKMAELAGFRGTDDAELVERLGVPIRIVESSWENLKITVPGDLPLAESILAKRNQ